MYENVSGRGVKLIKKDIELIKLKDVEEQLFELGFDIYEGDYTSLYKKEEKYEVYLEHWSIIIEELNINVKEAFYWFNDGIDYPAYYFFDKDTNEFLYSEQGNSLQVCVYNFCNNLGLIKSIDEVGEINCYLNY
jgi:hypothetical protein